MSRVICIMGESGSGKTTSMRNLPPSETLYVDADKKGLSWRGWRSNYSKENGNYMCCSKAISINKALDKIKTGGTPFKYVIIDTLNGIMIDDEMSRSKEKGYDKWIDLAACVWDLVSNALSLPDDLTVIFTAHTQTERDESGYSFTRIKTSGRKLDKIVLESKFTTVLYARALNGKYIFETHAKNSTAKTPFGAFEEDEVENDIVKVLEVLKDY